jgi:hypothetical protein
MKKILLFFCVILSTCSLLPRLSNKEKNLENKYNLIKVMNHFNTGLGEEQKEMVAEEILTLHEEYDLTSDITISLAAFLTEASLNFNCRMGTSGELGVGQIMPDTANEVCQKIGYKYYYGIQKDPIIALNIWYYIINENKQRFNGSLDKALLAYNMGGGMLNRYLSSGYSLNQVKYIKYGYKGWKAYDDKIKDYNKQCKDIIDGVI